MDTSTVAVITGASRGLGLAMAGQLLAAGATVITLARGTSPALAETAQRHGARLQQLQADLSRPASIESAAGLMSAALPGGASHYLLLNNAGTVDPVSLTNGLFDAESIETAFNLNVVAAMVLTAAFLRSTPPDADRRIVNISSGAGRSPTAGWPVYCATKAALDHYTRVLAEENPHLRVAAVAPGVIDTDMQIHIRGSDRGQFPDLDRFLQLHEQGQLASPESTASRILQHVASDRFGHEILDDIRNYDIPSQT
ncbi:MAG: SDR family NAD(P)-dependent oxidoreductase [Alcaligenaceae bacterium]|nr:SDR family NAD(P)-dependent oxidoreductase [Alcaligenaceae bacterium]